MAAVVCAQGGIEVLGKPYATRDLAPRVFSERDAHAELLSAIKEVVVTAEKPAEVGHSEGHEVVFDVDCLLLESVGGSRPCTRSSINSKSGLLEAWRHRQAKEAPEFGTSGRRRSCSYSCQ